MPRNIGIVDQVIRSILGLAFFAYVLNDGNFVDGLGLIGFIGAYLLGTAFFVYCPIYSALGLSSHGQFDRSA
jgi:hypothetical protein